MLTGIEMLNVNIRPFRSLNLVIIRTALPYGPYINYGGTSSERPPASPLTQVIPV